MAFPIAAAMKIGSLVGKGLTAANKIGSAAQSVGGAFQAGKALTGPAGNVANKIQERAQQRKQGLFNIATSFIGAGQRKREQKQAQRDFNLAQAAFRNQDTSNVYANMQNTMEDLTVNTQAADMAFQQQQQGIANTMAALGGAAGGSGIAAMAQAMAGQQAQNMQQASADIARQEQANQMAAAQQAAQIQSQQATGEMMSRQAEGRIIDQEFGMSMERKTAADQAIEAARRQRIGGVGSFLGVGGN